MQIKVDEDLPRQVVTLPREKGFPADSVGDQAMSGWKDAELWRRIQVENRFLITADTGFAVFAFIRLAPTPESGCYYAQIRMAFDPQSS